MPIIRWVWNSSGSGAIEWHPVRHRQTVSVTLHLLRWGQWLNGRWSAAKTGSQGKYYYEETTDFNVI